MTRYILLLMLAGCSSQESVPGKTPSSAAATQQPEPTPPPAPIPQGPEPRTPAPAAAQRPDANPTVQRAFEVIDSLIKAPLPGSPSRADGRALLEQNAWFKSLRDRLQNLLALVVAPAKVEQPAPVEGKHLKALQEEAEKESQQQPVGSAALKARHDLAMNAIQNMK